MSEKAIVPTENIYSEIRKAILEARTHVYVAANSAMVQTYWNIGHIIVEYEQGGEARAEYGKFLLQDISQRLQKEFGKGFTVRALQQMKKFYSLFPNTNTLCSQLSWSHYRLLLKIEKETLRTFYMEECAKSGWSVRQLERQINSFFYERLLASQDKDTVRQEIFDKESPKRPEDFIKDPYVLEFLDVKQDATVYEKDLETALINELQKFLLELGRGFAFVARQQHLDLEGDHFYIDLVFYNYLLKCFVLIDLKTTKLTHQDIGQMDTYVRIYDDLKKGEDDNPTIGIILCAEKNETIARYSVLKDSQQIFASKYQMTLPTQEELESYIRDERRRIEELEI